jgi:hypothetical protein
MDYESHTTDWRTSTESWRETLWCIGRVADPDPYQHSNCGSGSRRAKMTHKNRRKYRIFMF